MATIGLDKLYYAKITDSENGEESYGKPNKGHEGTIQNRRTAFRRIVCFLWYEA